MSNEEVRVAVAANRDVPDAAPEAFQDCRDVLHIALFFDGTGNNERVDEANQSWSNVARIYRASLLAAPFVKSGSFYPIYIPGVGTPFNGKAASWLTEVAIWLEDGAPGLGAAAGGDRRMEHGMEEVNDKLRRTLLANAKLMEGTVAKYASEGEDKSLAELNGILGKHRLIKVINFSFLGFSRGAALARAFSNRLISKCEVDNGGLYFNGYRSCIRFMGLFDTVASFGLPTQNARTPFTERNLIVSPMVERCVHYVAAHEVRFSFPVDLIRKNGELHGNWLERTFPGVHSDVGGGYDPKNQGIDNNFARIPMREMMRVASASGVRMLSYEDIKRRIPQFFVERYECRKETEESYRNYMSAFRSSGGSVEHQVKEHLKLYFSANGTMHRRSMTSPGERSRSASKLKYLIGSKGMAYEIWSYRAVKADSWLRLADRSTRGFAQYFRIHDWQLKAWDSQASEGVVNFISRYVHDSKVDFLYNIEPFSYFRPRVIQESSISIWQEAGKWVQAKTETIRNTTSGAVRSGQAQVAEMNRQVKNTLAGAERIYEAGKNWVIRTVDELE